MPALADGVLHEIVVEAGQDADVGAVLCRYDDGRDEVPAPATDTPASPPAAETAKAPVVAPPAAPAERSGAGVRATPLARRIARQNGVMLADVPGSGPRGRIEASDVQSRVQMRQGKPAATIRDAGVQGGHVERRDWTPPHATGPHTVLLHGLAADVQSWGVLAAALMRAGRPVSAIDLPGHGGTELAALDVDSAVAAVVGFLDRLGGEPVDLVGHSFGGAVAARAARLRPGRVRQLTLLAPAGLDRAIDTEFVRGIVSVSSEGALAHLLRRLVVRPAVLTPAQLTALATELGRGRLIDLANALVDEGGQRIDITGDLRALEMPTRIVWGLQDRIIPWTQVKEAGSRCAIHLIPDAGHVPHWDQPAEVAALFS